MRKINNTLPSESVKLQVFHINFGQFYLLLKFINSNFPLMSSGISINVLGIVYYNNDEGIDDRGAIT